MDSIYLVKTLPHLTPLFLNEGAVSISTNVYSEEIVNCLKSFRTIHKRDIQFKYVLDLLSKHNFQRVETVAEKLEFTLRGDILVFWPIGYDHPIKMNFFGEDLEEIYTVDELFGKKIIDLEFLFICDFLPTENTERSSIIISNYSTKTVDRNYKKFIFVNSLRGIKFDEIFEVVSTDFAFPQLFYSNEIAFKLEIERLKGLKFEVRIISKEASGLQPQADRLEASGQRHISNLKLDFSNISSLPAGFISNELKLAVFTDREIHGTIFLTRPERLKKSSSNIEKLLRQFEGNIEIGDYVVHEDYGIAIYKGLTQEEVDGITLEYLDLKFDKEDQLLVPITQIEKITKYIGNENLIPKLSRIGRVSWQQVKDKVKKSTSLLARELIEHLAKREVSTAVAIKNEDSKEFKDFVKDFPYSETVDQQRSINEVIHDLENTKPMNRLLVGDVGFGKTEVIMRATFKIVESGGQVVILAPTTILAQQHFDVFQKRFQNFPISVGLISRFNSKEKNNKTIDMSNEGKIDILIGTHRLLSSDVKFKNLQLVVVDEEQKFGVKQKEKIKKLNYGVHLLSVSATPIPRTLGMALSSIQDLSIISTPPVNRISVHTEILKNSWQKVVDSISFEISRGGQVFFLHNEVQTIQSVKLKLENLLPGVKFAIAHGQMNPIELDRVMAEFYMKKYDCLIATTIIENGLDVPSVNTIIVNQAHKFGLSQLYQLRGRVGRSDIKGYCYLFYEGKELRDRGQRMEDEGEGDLNVKGIVKRIPPKYLNRLETLVQNQDLGAGFRVASKDLEIRGAGNLLGDQQSGFISNIGYALYMEILAQEIEKLREGVEVGG